MSGHVSASSRELDEQLSAHSKNVSLALRDCPGDVAVLGAGGKMGFHLCRMLQKAIAPAGDPRRIIAVSRFADDASRQRFVAANLETISADLSKAGDVACLPAVPNVFYLAGVKFGTSSDPDLLRRVNIDAPDLVAQYYQQSRIVALSTGCVYSFTSADSGGSTEDSETDPPGDYARSCLGRESAFVNAARERQTRSALVRLNYSNEPRYGVLVDIAQKVLAGKPVDVTMGFVNVIWQRDAIDHIIQCLPHASAPPFIINVTGPAVLRVRDIASRFADLFNCEVRFAGSEAPTAWLNNASRCHRMFGKPPTTLDQMMTSIASWLQQGGETLDKPTHFETRDGAY